MDLFARRILGWQVADHLRSDLAIDALEMAIWTRRNEDISGLVHHSDRGVQYTSIRYTKRLEEAGAVRSVGSKGDSYDDAAAESLNSLYKRELIDLRAPWEGEDDVMVVTADWVQWYNDDRIDSYAGDMPPKKYEEAYYKALRMVFYRQVRKLRSLQTHRGGPLIDLPCTPEVPGIHLPWTCAAPGESQRPRRRIRLCRNEYFIRAHIYVRSGIPTHALSVLPAITVRSFHRSGRKSDAEYSRLPRRSAGCDDAFRSSSSGPHVRSARP